MIDILDFLVLPDQSLNLGYSRQTHGTTGTAGPSWDVVDMSADAEGYSKRYKLKTAKGWPWDITRFNKDVVLDWVTELTWTSARDYKKNIQNYKDPVLNRMVDGKAMFPRFIRGDYNYTSYPTLKAQTEYHMYNNCVWDNAKHFLGDNVQTLFGPIMFDFGGTIGSQPTLVHQFMWGAKTPGNYNTKEENLYAYHYGWLRWTLNTLDPTTGMFKVNKVSARNSLIAQPPPPVIFPCM